METLRARGALQARRPLNSDLAFIALFALPALRSNVSSVTLAPPDTSVARQTYRARRALVSNYSLRTCCGKPRRQINYSRHFCMNLTAEERARRAVKDALL